MGFITAIGLLLLTGAVQLALETSSELTAETFADNDVGIVSGRARVATGDMIDLDPAVMVVSTR